MWRRRERKAFLRLIWAGIAITSLGFVIVTGWISMQSRARTLDAATDSIQNLALVLEKLMARKIDAIETLLQTALHEGKRVQGQPGAQPSTSLLAELTQDHPYVRTVKLIDATDGRTILNLNDTGEAGDGIDLEVDRVYRERSNLDLYVSRPRRDGASRRWLMGVSRLGQPGTSAGTLIAVAHVDIEQLQQLFDEINIGQNGTIALWRSDGMLLARKPYIISNVGRQFPNAALFGALVRSPTGHFETVSVADGFYRMVAYRALPGTPIIITATMSKEEVLAPWRRDLLREASLVSCAILILIVFGILMTRVARRRADAEAAAKQKSDLLEATLENMDQGLIMYDADARVQVCNRRAMELLDLPASLMLSQPSFEEVRRYQIDNGEFVFPEREDREWVRSTTYERTLPSYERERPNGTVLEIRTVPIAHGGAVRTFTDITERKQVEKRIAHMARHDALTGLPNRILFRERIEEALERVGHNGETLAILCLDLDQFKTVNDTLGHPVGDVLLSAVAGRIKTHLSENDTVARLGGDEFAILQVGPRQPGGARSLAQRLVQGMPEPFFVDGHKLNIGVSVGIALAPSDGLNVDSLLKCADLALYRAKGEGRDTFRFFEQAMDTELQARRAIETDLREAFTKGEFQLHYQPFMDIARGEVVGFEALLRWNHPSRGFIPPAEFIPIAEETGLIVALGEWIIRQACKEAAQFPEALRVAVNVSAVQFRNPQFPQFVLSALAASGLSPHRLELEITETVLMQSNETVLKTLHQLRGLGVRIALDDFGTGYSSLSYLSSFPFDKLKIDRSFTKELGTNPHCAAIVRAIISLGASLGMVTTAEGVETAAQLDFLGAAGCAEAQGFLVNEPKPAQEAVKVLPRARGAAVA
jgi:diguanylate cyclase (GGDEF)-like protein